MEVHHHPKTPGSHPSRKKWAHYFWEFFMLFLAVSLGFFVENQREHYVERQRAKEYAKLLEDDLASDIAEFNRSERVFSIIISAGDSLGKIFNTENIKEIPGGKIYYYEYWSGWRWSITSRDATLQQLKNSGSLRYMHNSSLVRKILDYEESIKVIYMLQNKYEQDKTQNWNLVQKVFYQDYFNLIDADPHLARDSTGKGFLPSAPRDSFLSRSFPLNTYDQNIFFELRNWAYNSSRNYKVLLNDLKTARRKAHELVEALKEEY
jgi:hypothetical protein